MSSDPNSVRRLLKQRLGETQQKTCDVLLRLLAISSENPPGDTTLLAQEISTLLQSVEGIDIDLITAVNPITNVVATIHGGSPGRRLIFNGHLDTFEIGDLSKWSASPYGEVRDGQIFGRGAADMKGGLAVQIFAALRLAEIRDHWCGELVLTLTGDEETSGPNGTQYLLETCERAVGDAVLCADAGTPTALHFGEKGMLWLTIEADGTAGHGAHTHLSMSAIDRLLDAISALRPITGLEAKVPANVAAAIEAAAEAPGHKSSLDEARMLTTLTLNFGTIKGGTTRNLVADHAEVTADFRLPIGISLDQLKAEIDRKIGRLPGIQYHVDCACEPTVTDPDHEIVLRTAQTCKEILRERPVSTIRIGASDASLYRNRGIPSLVCGLTPHNMGGPDESVSIDELQALAEIYALTAFDYLTAPQTSKPVSKSRTR